MNPLEKICTTKNAETTLKMNHLFKEFASETLTLGHDENWAEKIASYGIAYDEALEKMLQDKGIQCKVPSTFFTDFECEHIVTLSDGTFTLEVPAWHGNLEVKGIGAMTAIWLDFNHFKQIQSV